MIAMFEYSAEAIDALYTAIENAVQSNSHVNMDVITKYIHQGDFYLRGNATNGLCFTINGLKWVDKDGEIYHCLLQPQIIHGRIWPEWEVIITVNDRTYTSSGRTHMIQKENRYISSLN